MGILRPVLAFLLFFQFAIAQENDNAAILKTIFGKYYQNEKVIKPGRLQLLSFYCNKAPNNDEVREVINTNDFLKKDATEIKSQIMGGDEDWSKELAILFTGQNQYLKSKVNDCLSLEEYQKISKRLNLNNQRLLIVSKPIYFGQNGALVKITFYRNIEHNNGGYLLMEKTGSDWSIKQILNAWST